MRTLLYLAAGILAAPGAAFAFYLWNVAGAARQVGLLQLLWYLWNSFMNLLIWGTWFIIPAFIAWLVLAFIPKYQFIGAIGMALVVVASLVEYFVVLGPPREIGELFFPLLSLSALFLNVWLAWLGVSTLLVKN